MGKSSTNSQLNNNNNNTITLPDDEKDDENDDTPPPSYLSSWWTQLGIGTAFVVASVGIQWIRMMSRSRRNRTSDDGGGGYAPVGGKEGAEETMTELTTVRTTTMEVEAEYGNTNDDDVDEQHESGEFVNAAAAAVIARKRNSL